VHLFNLSIQTGEFPNNLKMSRTVPIFKSGDPTLCDNYRPISLLSSISKVLEKAVAIRLISHLKSNNLLSENQFERYSTIHHLLKLTNYVTNEINKKTTRWVSSWTSKRHSIQYLIAYCLKIRQIGYQGGGPQVVQKLYKW
jgi:hypothetical protein